MTGCLGVVKRAPFLGLGHSIFTFLFVLEPFQAPFSHIGEVHIMGIKGVRNDPLPWLPTNFFPKEIASLIFCGGGDHVR